MKICENCGMEYGDDSSFCPYCDERYGVVISENDVISANFPAYSEEFPPIGETCVNEKSFTANRDEIFERNTRLTEIENFMPKVEVKKAYKPVVPLVQIESNGSIAPYKPPNPIAEKLFNRRKTLKTAKVSKLRKILCISVVIYIFLLLIAFISWFRTTDTYYRYKEIKEYEKYIKVTPLPEEITFTNESGIEFKLTYECYVDSNFYRYNFEFTNTTDNVIDNIYKEFEDLEFSDKFLFLSAGLYEYVSWDDGVAHVYQISPINPGETVRGQIRLDFSDD